MAMRSDAQLESAGVVDVTDTLVTNPMIAITVNEAVIENAELSQTVSQDSTEINSASEAVKEQPSNESLKEDENDDNLLEPPKRRSRLRTLGTVASRRRQRSQRHHSANSKDGDHKIEGHHSAHKVPFYSRPHQAKNWGDEDPTHDFDSFGLFFDLIYVGGAYAAGLLLYSDLSYNGVMYFISVVMVLHETWHVKLSRDARFHFKSAFHSLCDMLNLVLIMLLVLHIEYMPKMLNPETKNALWFSSVSLLIRFLDFLRNVEISYTATSENGRRWWKMALVGDSTMIVAFAVSTYMCTTETETNMKYVWIPWFIATATTPLILAGLLKRSKLRGTSKRDIVPINITYWIHRNAEWVMLILGESIFNLLIIPSVPTFDFNIIFIMGTVIVANVYYHHFELYEETPKYHALTMSASRGLFFSFSRRFISVTMVAMGVSFKAMLSYKDKDYLSPKYINLFSIPFALSLFLSDVTALLHNNGTNSFFEYVRIVVSHLHKPVGRNLALLWLGKFAIYATSISLSQLKLNSVSLAASGMVLSFAASLLVIWQSEPATDITSLKRTPLLTEIERRQKGAVPETCEGCKLGDNPNELAVA